MKLPLKTKAIIIGVAIIFGILLLVVNRARNAPPPAGKPSDPPPDPAQLINVPPPTVAFPPGSTELLFCLWNMENLFDDRNDRRGYPDADYDRWFVDKPEDRKRKYERLAEWLLKLNNGIGPDIVVGNEIESRRAAEILQETLNSHLPPGAPPYRYVAMEELSAGRHIAPCVVSRYPLSRAKLLGSRQRILQVVVTINNHDLLLIAAHWTSQITDKGEREDTGRTRYASVIHEAYANVIRENPLVDVLVCGDFNDSPDSESVYRFLHMIGDSRVVTPDTNPPRLFGLLSGKRAEEYGTLYYSGPLIYDQIGVSPGMFDTKGWGYEQNSVDVPTDGLIRFGTRGRRPWRYGSINDDALGRGYSDHFPVTVRLKVAP